jgi:hypothetical protein
VPFPGNVIVLKSIFNLQGPGFGPLQAAQDLQEGPEVDGPEPRPDDDLRVLPIEFGIS